MSTAVSTEMPTSAAFSAGPSLMPSPRKPTTWPLRCSARMMRSFCAGDSLAKTVVALGGFGELRVAHRLDLARRAAISLDGQPDLAADLARDDLVVAGQDLDLHALARQRRDRLARAVLGRVEEGDEAEQGQVGLVRDANRSVFDGVHLLVGDGDDAEAVGVQLRGLAAWPPRNGLRRAVRSRSSSSSCVQTAKISSTAPLQISMCLPSARFDHHRHAPAQEIERDLVDLAVAAVDARASACSSTCSRTASSSRFFSPVW